MAQTFMKAKQIPKTHQNLPPNRPEKHLDDKILVREKIEAKIEKYEDFLLRE